MAKDKPVRKRKAKLREAEWDREKGGHAAPELTAGIELYFRERLQAAEAVVGVSGVGRVSELQESRGDAQFYASRDIEGVLSGLRYRIDEVTQALLRKTAEQEATQKLVESAVDMVKSYQKLLDERTAGLRRLQDFNESLLAQLQESETIPVQRISAISVFQEEIRNLPEKADMGNDGPLEGERIRQENDSLEIARAEIWKLREAEAASQEVIAGLQEALSAKETELENGRVQIDALAKRVEAEAEAASLKEGRIAALEEETKRLDVAVAEKTSEIVKLSKLVLELEKPKVAKFGARKQAASLHQLAAGAFSEAKKAEPPPADAVQDANYQRERGLVERSGLFDAAWYLDQNPDVVASGHDALDHYLQIGCKEGRDPSPRFKTERYYELNRDAPGKTGNALLHYLSYSPSES